MSEELKVTNKELLEELSKRGYFASKVPPQVTGNTFVADETKVSGNKYRFAVISCTQIGSKYQQLSHLYTFYEVCRQHHIKTVFHCGD